MPLSKDPAWVEGRVILNEDLVFFDGWALVAYENEGDFVLMANKDLGSMKLVEALEKIQATDRFKDLMSVEALDRRMVWRVELYKAIIENSRNWYYGWSEVRRERRDRDRRVHALDREGRDEHGQDKLGAIGSLVPELKQAILKSTMQG